MLCQFLNLSHGLVQYVETQVRVKDLTIEREASNRKRLISITGGNLRNHHLYISGYHDFFPEECYGESNARKAPGHKLTLIVGGLPEPVQTDIAKSSGCGRARSFFRKRAWVGRFFQYHDLHEGDIVAIERLDPSTYRIYPFRNGKREKGTVKPSRQERCAKFLPGVIESAAGDNRSGFGDTALTKNRQEPLHRWARGSLCER